MGFEGIAVVGNSTIFSLPTEFELDPDQQHRLNSLQARKHLQYVRTIKDRDGAIVREDKPLTSKDRKQMDEWELKMRLRGTPRVGDVHYRFTPKGEQGSIWIMPAGHANILVMQNWVGVLEYLKWGEVPQGITPLQPSRVPSANMITYGTEDPGAPGDPQGESIARAPITKDGHILDAGDQIPIKHRPLDTPTL